MYGNCSIYDSGNKLLTESVGGVTTTYGYDSNGNLISKQVGSGTPVKYAWDSDDKMTSVDDATDLTFKTDASGFRRRKTVSGGTDTIFIYDLAGSQMPGLRASAALRRCSGCTSAAGVVEIGSLVQSSCCRSNEGVAIFAGSGHSGALVPPGLNYTDPYVKRELPVDAWKLRVP